MSQQSKIDYPLRDLTKALVRSRNLRRAAAAGITFHQFRIERAMHVFRLRLVSHCSAATPLPGRVVQGKQGRHRRTAGVICPLIILAIAVACGGAFGGHGSETKPKQTLAGHDRWVLSLAISPDGRRLASGSDDQTLRMWDLTAAGPKPKTLRRFDSAVTALAFSRDGKRLAVGTWDGELLLCNSASGEVLLKLAEHKETINAVVFDPSGDYLASGSADDTLIIWDATTGEGLLSFHQGNEYDVTTAAFSPDGERIVTGDGENELKVWDASTGDEIETLTGHEEPITCAAFLADGRIVSGSWDDSVRIWDGDKAVALRGHTGDVTALALHPKSGRIVSASEDETLRVWDARSGKPLDVLRGHTDSIRCVAISPDGRTIVSGSRKSIHVWPLTVASLAPGARAAARDWPQANGPTGNFNPKRYGDALVDDFSSVRRLWMSKGADLGFAKGSSSGYLRHLTEADTHPGAASGLIVAEGKVFASSFRPSGEVWAENMPHLRQEKNLRYLEGEAGKLLRANAAILADDFTVALDLRTGDVVWKSVEERRRAQPLLRQAQPLRGHARLLQR